MAAIASNAAHPAELVRGRLKTVLTIVSQMLDAFVSYRMRRITAEASHVCPRPARLCFPRGGGDRLHVVGRLPGGLGLRGRLPGGPR
jgi:hypothetical protein